MTIAIMTPTLAPGDGVGNDVLGMADALTRDGRKPFLSAIRTFGSLPSVPVSRLSELLQDPDDLFIYHHSIECAEGLELLETLPCRKVVKYHNITPPHFYQSMTPATARLCEAGLRQLERITQLNVPIWADSPFNARELKRSAPERDVSVLPPFNQVEQLLACDPDMASVVPFDDWRTNLLLVGRVVPNKNVLLAVDGFAEYLKVDATARLIIVGDFGKTTYCRAVMNRIKELQIERHVVITGKVTIEQLKALYLIAQALLVTSSHEGFCLPLVEAMALRVPIVATRSTAIPDTAGEAAWYVKSESASELAGLIETMLANYTRREFTLNAGYERFRDQFRNVVIARQFQEMLKLVIPAPSEAAV
jgi:glycosyltransferase involved in cell wall biosynthesis